MKSNNEHARSTRTHFLRVLAVIAFFLSSLCVAPTVVAQNANSAGKGNSSASSKDKDKGKGVNRAHNGRNKIADDLDRALKGQGNGREKWIKQTSRGALMSVIILAEPGNDFDLKDLRRAVAASGGSINRKFSSLAGVVALLPPGVVRQLAQRSDVWRVAPNRSVTRSSSMMEMMTGTDGVRGLGAAGALDGSGVGIAFLDSGVMSTHASLLGADGASRVKLSVDFTSPLATLDTPVDSSNSLFQDPYGHGTVVASMAAGRAVPGSMDTTGIAPGASLYDVRVLDATGSGDVATVIAGIDWVVAHASQYGIRVLNISLGTDSSDSYLTDPLCAAVRAAVASGITVVVAAGNYGSTPDGREVYGSISSPGDEPSVITVGSANNRGTPDRGDDIINAFSGRGPTRGTYLDDTGTRQHDNVVKPDLVAPGNRVIGALSTDRVGLVKNLLTRDYPQLVVSMGAPGTGLMLASGTSFSTPVISGTVALLLQANPGLTPPLIKAILQYTAEPLPGYNVLQQGAGLVNVPGALMLANALATGLAPRIAAGTIPVGSSMLAPGQTLPPPFSVIDSRSVNWSSFVFMGGRYVLSGADLFNEYQAAYDPRLLWVGASASWSDPNAAAPTGDLVSSGVISLTGALGSSSLTAHTGLFMPALQISQLSGSGIVLAEGIDLVDGIVLAEGIDLGDGIVLAEGVPGDGIVLAEGVVLTDGLVLAEQAMILGE
jgi:subtilisin family serine protease